MIVDNYKPVTEAYFGKTKNLMEIEKLIAGIIKRLTVPLKQGGVRIIDAARVNNSELNKKIEALFCKEFGFKEMILHWDGSPEFNACTITYGLIKLADGSQPAMPIRNGDGTYYDSKHIYICVVNVYAGFIDSKVTPEELVACILHEIGHNFVCTPIVTAVTAIEWALVPVNLYKSISSIANVVRAGRNIKDALDDEETRADLEKCKAIASSSFVQAFMSWFRFGKYWELTKWGVLNLFHAYFPEMAKKQFQEMDEWILLNKNKVLAKWNKYLKDLEKLKEYYKQNPNFLNTTAFVSKGFDIVRLIFWHDLATIEHFLTLQSGYSNEVFADSFASAYGYGAATVSLQRRIEYVVLKNRALSKKNKYNVYNQYIYIMTDIMTTFLDEHPASQTRMKNQIDKLKRDLEDPDVDPRIRKELLADLEKAEGIYNEYLNNFPPELKHLAVIMNYNQLNEMYFGGKFDLREPINRVLNFGKAEA